jgi:hypothetical protein
MAFPQEAALRLNRLRLDLLRLDLLGLDWQVLPAQGPVR